MMHRIFTETWGARAGEAPQYEFWWEIIRAVKAAHPDLRFMAEAYWDMEWELLQQGFDYCYDKRLYDRLAHAGPAAVQAHLQADPAYQSGLVRFIENHDEPRAAAVFSPWQGRAAAVVAATLPGARLFHQGQLEGAQLKLPVQLGRRFPEPASADLHAFYTTLLAALRAPVFHTGTWRLCECSGWPDNASYANLAAWCWQDGDDRRVIVVNLAGQAAQGQVALPWDDLAGREWLLEDAFSGAQYRRAGDELLSPGLFVDLERFGFHFLRVRAAMSS
jgi:hypothetical protein